MEEIYVAEYNPAQKQFHVEWKSEKYKKAKRYILKLGYDGGSMNEPLWIPFFEGTCMECLVACNKLGFEMGIYNNDQGIPNSEFEPEGYDEEQ